MCRAYFQWAMQNPQHSALLSGMPVQGNILAERVGPAAPRSCLVLQHGIGKTYTAEKNFGAVRRACIVQNAVVAIQIPQAVWNAIRRQCDTSRLVGLINPSPHHTAVSLQLSRSIWQLVAVTPIARDNEKTKHRAPSNATAANIMKKRDTSKSQKAYERNFDLVMAK